MRTSFESSPAPSYGTLNPSNSVSSTNPTQIFNASPYKQWEKYVIRVQVKIESNYEGSRVIIFRVKGRQEYEGENKVSSTDTNLGEELLSRCSNLRISTTSSSWLVDHPDYANHLILKTSECNIQGISQFHIPEDLWPIPGPFRQNFMDNIVFGGYSNLIQKFEFSATDHTYLKYYMDGYYDQTKLFNFLARRDWIGINLLADNFFEAENPLPKFFGVPFGKQNELRESIADSGVNTFKESSALMNL